MCFLLSNSKSFLMREALSRKHEIKVLKDKSVRNLRNKQLNCFPGEATKLARAKFNSLTLQIPREHKYLC